MTTAEINERIAALKQELKELQAAKGNRENVPSNSVLLAKGAPEYELKTLTLWIRQMCFPRNRKVNQLRPSDTYKRPITFDDKAKRAIDLTDEEYAIYKTVFSQIEKIIEPYYTRRLKEEDK